jgi:hypothetical protein
MPDSFHHQERKERREKIFILTRVPSTDRIKPRGGIRPAHNQNLNHHAPSSVLFAFFAVKKLP